MLSTQSIIAQTMEQIEIAKNQLNLVMDLTLSDLHTSPEEKEKKTLETQHAINSIDKTKSTFTNELIRYDLFYK